ncbi:hypothetical protein EDB83DRAFT_2380510 [Lactarius deliciosus]|nr:hypothetical protein EDB83DRAFT_2380510 [Lactarius deliciosus]
MLLLSASDLVKLDLWDIPPTGYISPEAMVACLATLPRLVHLAIGFRSETSCPDRIRPLPITRTVIPALTSFRFVGASEYLEDLVAHIDGPQLNQITIDYLRLVGYQITQFSEFVNRSVGPKLTLYTSARVHFFSDSVSFIVSDRGSPEVFMLCGGVNWHVLDISRLLGHFRTPLSNVVHLHLGVGLEVNPRYEDMVNVDWLHLLRQFSTAQTLHLSRQPAEYVARALNVISVELVAEVLPSLDLICLVGQLFRTSSMEKFVDKLIAARELSGCPVTVVDVLSETECDEGLESYVRK